MKTPGRVVCFTGPSGVGKTSYIKRLVEKHGFVLSAIVTTRQPRSDDGGHYRYVTESNFLEMTLSDAFLEWDRYADYYYGTLAQSVHSVVRSSNSPGVMLDITPNGCRKVAGAIPSAILIALLPDDPAWLLERLKSRNLQSPEEIRVRTNLLQSYLEEVNSLICRRVYASFSPDSWDKTFEAIEQIVLSS